MEFPAISRHAHKTHSGLHPGSRREKKNNTIHWIYPEPRMPVTTRIIIFLGSGITIYLHLPLVSWVGRRSKLSSNNIYISLAAWKFVPMIKIAGCRRGQPPGNVIGRILAGNFQLLCIGISTVLQSFVICREKQKKSRAGAKNYKFRSCCHLESWFTPTTCDKHLVLKSETGSSSGVF